MNHYKSNHFRRTIINHENAGIKHLHDPDAFIECSNMMNDLYENINDYNLSSRRKILIVFDDIMADIMTNKEFKAIIKELFIRYKKLNVSLVLITVLFFCPKRCQIKFNTLFDYEN